MHTQVLQSYSTVFQTALVVLEYDLPPLSASCWQVMLGLVGSQWESEVMEHQVATGRSEAGQ